MSSPKFEPGDIVKFRNTQYGDLHGGEGVVIRTYDDIEVAPFDYSVRFIDPHLRHYQTMLVHEHELQFVA